MARLFLAFWAIVISAGSLRAQQNLFNIPSGDLTPQGKHFYQHQINVYADTFDSKSQWVYGLGKGWDAGCNVVLKKNTWNPLALGKQSNPEQGAIYPLLLGSLQKQWQLKPNQWEFNVGIQVGSDRAQFLSQSTWAGMAYGITRYHFSNHGRWVLGGHVANANFQGTRGQWAGLMTGFEYALTDTWYVMGDWLSGRNDMGEGVLGVMYLLTPRVQLCTGALWANPSRFQGVVFEVNLLGW